MKKIVLTSVALLIGLTLFAQNRSVVFLDCSMKEAAELAKKNNKPIFVDCYTSWCGPCKMMAKDVFTKDIVADYLNDNFICLKFDCEKGEGRDVASTFKVSSYPTFLLIDKNNQLIHKFTGASAPEKFIEDLKKGFDEESSTYGKRKKYESGNYDIAFLKSYFYQLRGINDAIAAREVGNKIMDMTSKDSLFTKEIWEIMSYYNISPYGSKWWNFILENDTKYIELVGAKKFDEKISGTMHPHIFVSFIRQKPNRTKINFEEYETLIKKYDLSNKDILRSFCRLGMSYNFDDFDGFFKTVIKEYKRLDLSEHNRVMANIIDHLSKNVNAKQKGQLIKILKESEAQQNDYMKKGYSKFYDKLG